MSKPADESVLNELMCYNVYALHHAFGRFYQSAFNETGFTYPKFIVLLALEEAGPMSLSELSAMVGLEANSLSPMVKKMSSFELVDRVRDPQDERRVLLTILPYGKTVLGEAKEVVDAIWEELGIGGSTVEKTNAFLKDVRNKLEQTAPKRKMSIPKRDDQS